LPSLLPTLNFFCGYDEVAQACARAAVQEAAQVMINPADLINVALAELPKQHYELPTFDTLDQKYH